MQFVVLRDGRAVGSTSYLSLAPEHLRLEIGNTWMNPSTWGTGANVEAKYLLLRHAFETLGCRRVEFKTDARNERARAALAALPAEFEGIHRKHMLVRDGERRDSAWYAVIDDDWPQREGRRSSGGSRRSSRLLVPGIRLRNWSSCSSQSTSSVAAASVSAVAARLEERGVELREDAELVLLCVPDAAIAATAAGTVPGTWPVGRARQRRDAASCARSAHAALRDAPAADVHALARRRSSSTARGRRSPRESDEARAARPRARARRSGCARSTSTTTRGPLYHAGAAIASNYLVTLHRAASRLFEAAGAPPEALVPLMTRTIENGFDLTGPIARGDWDTVDAHVRAIHDEAPDLEPMYLALAEATRP